MSPFLLTRTESETLGDLRDVDEDVLASGDDSDIFDVCAEAEDSSCQGGQFLDGHLNQGDVLALLEGEDQEADVSDDEEQPQPVLYSHTCIHEIDDSDAAFDDDIWTTRNDPNPAPDFQGVSGLVTQPAADADVSYFLGLFLHDEFFDLVMTQTNLCAEQFIAATILTNHALTQAWKPTSRHEMKR